MPDYSLTVDLSQAQAALDGVVAETQIVLEDIHRTEGENERVENIVRQTVKQSHQQLRGVLRAARRTVGIMRGLFIISGNALSEATASYIEAAILSAEILLDLAAADALTVIGAVRALPRIGLALALFAKANALRRQDAENARVFEGAIIAFTSLSFNIYIDPIALLLGLIWLVKIMNGEVI